MWRMTDGEITFHLREILGHWTAPRITTITADELQRLGLIEISEDRRMIRLTPLGVQRKTVGRIAVEDSTVSSVQRRREPRRKQQRGQQQRGPRRSRGKKFLAPRPLV